MRSGIQLVRYVETGSYASQDVWQLEGTTLEPWPDLGVAAREAVEHVAWAGKLVVQIVKLPATVHSGFGAALPRGLAALTVPGDRVRRR